LLLQATEIWLEVHWSITEFILTQTCSIQVDSIIIIFKSHASTVFKIAKNWKQPKCSHRGKWANKLWYGRRLEYYSVTEGTIDTPNNMGKSWKKLCKMKETRHKRINPVWFYLHEVQEQFKLIYDDRNQEVLSLGPRGTD